MGKRSSSRRVARGAARARAATMATATGRSSFIG